jgi:phospholipid transport system substrate-binding protein
MKHGSQSTMNRLPFNQPSAIVNTTFRWTVLFSMVVVASLSQVRTATAQNAASSVSADEREVRVMLEDRDRSIKTLLGSSESISPEQKEALRLVINDVIDFYSMGRSALGRHWDDLTEDQRNDFINTFSQIVRIQSLADIDVYRSRVTYDRISIDGDEAHVVTTTTYKDVPTPVEYLLHRTDAGWLATDIILDDVSTVKGYARSFQSVIRKKGFSDLMARLEKRLVTEEAAEGDA